MIGTCPNGGFKRNPTAHSKVAKCKICQQRGCSLRGGQKTAARRVKGESTGPDTKHPEMLRYKGTKRRGLVLGYYAPKRFPREKGKKGSYLRGREWKTVGDT